MVMQTKKTRDFIHYINLEYYSEPDGKWILRASISELRDIADAITPLVSSGQLYWMKYSKYAKHPDGTAMIFYASNSNKERIRTVLESIGLEGLIWRTEEETRRATAVSRAEYEKNLFLKLFG